MLTVDTHIRQPDGTVRLVLRMADGAVHVGDPESGLLAVCGVVTVDGDDALIGWEWSAAMVPPAAVAVCADHVRQAVLPYAAGVVAPSSILLSEPGAPA